MYKELKEKQIEFKSKINKNKHDIDVLDKNLSPLRDISSVLSFCATVIPANRMILGLPINAVLKCGCFLGAWFGLDKFSKKLADKLQGKDELKKIVPYGSDNNKNIIAKAKYEKEIENEKYTNLTKVINNIENNIDTNKKVDVKQDNTSLTEDKENIQTLSTQKVLKQNYSKVKTVSQKKRNICTGAIFATMGAAVASMFVGGPVLTYALLGTCIAESYVLAKTINKLAQKEELKDINKSLGENALTEHELCDENTKTLDYKLSKVINKVADKVYASSKQQDKKEHSKVEEKTLGKENTYDYNLMFDYKPQTLKRAKTYSLSKFKKA